MTEYQAPLFFRNGHRQSIYPTIFRKVKGVHYRRQKITTPDDDFLDLDWVSAKSDKLVVISHGLEGNSQRAYVKGMVKAVTDAGFDALAWNFRGCGGTINRQPCDLKAGSKQIGKPGNQIYMKRFLRLLHEKIKAKKPAFPDLFDDRDYKLIKNFHDFDNRYTAPIHGFIDADDYWHQCSSKQFLNNIHVPTLMVSALDDPFLAQACYPFTECAANPHLTLETPKHGGHVGFVTFNRDKRYWSEERCIKFLKG